VRSLEFSEVPTTSFSTAGFDGINDYIGLGDILNYGDADFFFTGWVYIDPAALGNSEIFGRYGNTDSTRAYRLLYNESSGILDWLVQGGSTNTQVTRTISKGVWTFFACGYDSVAQEAS